jgi:hypothetical protein
MSKPRCEPYSRWPGILHTDGWAGRVRQPCDVVGETATRFLITTRDAEIRLPGNRIVPLGNLARVPKRAVTRDGGGEAVEYVQGRGEPDEGEGMKP